MTSRAIQVDVRALSRDANGRVYDPGFEVGIEAQRWFYYKHKWQIGAPVIRSAEQLREFFKQTHRMVYGRAATNAAYETVILEKDIHDFIEAHKDRVAELEMLR